MSALQDARKLMSSKVAASSQPASAVTGVEAILFVLEEADKPYSHKLASIDRKSVV